MRRFSHKESTQGVAASVDSHLASGADGCNRAIKINTFSKLTIR